MKYTIIALLFFLMIAALPAQTTLPVEMVFVQGGTFTMGCTVEQTGCSSDETPTRLVRIPSFEIGKYEVTQAQWELVMGNDNPPPYFNNNPARPMEKVSYYDCLTYCNRLSVLEGLEPVYYFDPDYTMVFDSLVGNIGVYVDVWAKAASKGYRFPTEAEWEYAARGGSVATVQTLYSGSSDVNAVAWYIGNSGNATHNGGTMADNDLGLYDMSGNVWEWCYDTHSDYADSAFCSWGSLRVLRGGSWANFAVLTRVAFRYYYYPGYRTNGIGFRLSRIL